MTLKSTLTRKAFSAMSLFLTFAFANAQTTPAKLQAVGQAIQTYHTNKTNELNQDSANERYFSTGAYNRFFDKYFTQIKYERESITEGNSAALKVADNKTRLNLTLSKKSQNWIFSVGTALNVTDNSGIILSGDKPTAGTEFSAGVSKLFPSLRKLSFTGQAQSTNYHKRRELLDSVLLVHSIRNPNYGDLLIQKIQRLNNEIARFNGLVAITSTPKMLALYKDSLVSAANDLVKAKSELNELDNGFSTPSDVADDLKKKTDKLMIEKELATAGVNWFRMGWFSGGFVYRRDSYTTYDSTLAFSKRIEVKNFDKWTLSSAFNFFWQRTDSWIAFQDSKLINSFYGNINYSLIRTNNFEDISENTLSITRARTQNDTSYEFSSSKKYRDISDTSFVTGWINRIGIVLTPMLGKKQFFGLNVLASTDLQSKRGPVFNTHLGFLFRFKDTENEKSRVNFEFFFAFNDMTDTRKKEKSVWQNKEIGITATIPFQKVFF